LFVSYRVDDGNVATQSHDDNAVRRQDQRIPERFLLIPDATNELVVGAVAGPLSTVLHVSDRIRQNEDRRQHVYHALVDDQNAHDLNRITTSDADHAGCILTK